jgi:hypothetical protein
MLIARTVSSIEVFCICILFSVCVVYGLVWYGMVWRFWQNTDI